MLMKLNLQRFAPPITQTVSIILNGEETGIPFAGDTVIWGESYTILTTSGLPTSYSIVDNKVVWNDGTILQYNGTDVLPTDKPITNGVYTTRTATTKTIKIKFKDSITIPSSLDLTINFTYYNGSIAHPCTKMVYQMGWLRYQESSGMTDVYEVNWADAMFKVIEIDPSQEGFSDFITAMKNNIDSVELAPGTYKWGITDSSSSVDNVLELTFISNSTTYTSLSISNELKFIIDYNDDRVYNTGTWTNENYKIIILNTAQYVPFSFYNYAILGNQLIKQENTTTIESGTYLWNDALTQGNSNFSIDISFTSNNLSFVKLIFAYEDVYLKYVDSSGKTTFAFNEIGWTNYAYKTIVVPNNTSVPTDFKTWFDSNTTKQTSYSITYNLTNCTSDSSNPTTIENTASVIITANKGYKLPSTIAVTNATYTYEQSTGMIDLSDPTGDVTITVVATQDDIIVYENQLVSIANAIRQVNSSSAKIKLDDMPDLIGTFAKPTGTKTITDTNVTDVRNYANAQVSDANLASANIVTDITILGITGSYTSDGTLDASKMLKGVIGYSKGVKYTGTIDTYSGATTITSNGTINTANKYLPSNLTINVVTPTQEKSVTITGNGETSVTPDANYHLSKVTITTNVARPTLSGDATEEDVLQGKTFYSNDYNLKTGTLVPLTYEELLAATYPPIVQDGDMLTIYNADATQEGDEVTIL